LKKVTLKKIGLFITQLIEPYTDKKAHCHTSRRVRKGLPKLLINISNHNLEQSLSKLSIFTYQPKALTWWVAVLFMLGSLCFISASVMVSSFEDSFSGFMINLTFFIGSVFFTSAGYAQLLEVINKDITSKDYLKVQSSTWLWWAWRPKNLGYLSSVTQLTGTILFNFNTFDAFYSGLSVLQEDIIIWVPNMLGSMLFITASFFAWLEIYHDKHIQAFISTTWWIIWINILGSLFFQLSAIFSYIHIDSGTYINETLLLRGTIYGAICFFVAAYLLIIEMNEKRDSSF